MYNVKKLLKRSFLIKAENYNVRNREDKAEFIAKVFKVLLKNSVLDVGCGNALLKKYLSKSTKYTGIDIVGEPDMVIDLEKDKLNQFEDQSYHTVICTEVLEHLDNLHEVFNDLCRVTSKFLIISLPNPWGKLKFLLISGKGQYKFYGLPINPPKDRHKWFFNYDDAQKFIDQKGRMNNFELIASFPSTYPKIGLKQKLFDKFFQIYYGNNFGFNNLYYNNIWAVLKRKII